MHPSPPQRPLWRLLNRPLARLHSALRHPHTPAFPTSFVIETTSRCNLNCRMCPRRDMRRAAQDMSPELFYHLIDQMKPWDAGGHIRFLALHLFGEPLLHPQAIELIQYAGDSLPNLLTYGRERDAMRGLTLSTNATVLDEKAARGLLNSPLTWLGVSVDGSSAGTYESLRCGGAFEQVMANVRQLLEINAGLGRDLPTIAIQVIATPETLPEFEEAGRHWQALGHGRPNVRVELKPWTNWAGQVDDLPGTAQRRDFLHLDCGRLHDTLVIAAGGEIALCCYDVQAAQDLGNAARQTIEEIWQGRRLQELRRKMRWGRLEDLPLCSQCAMGRKYPLDYLRRR